MKLKKKNITMTLILLVLLCGYLLIRNDTSSMANQYVEGKITGTFHSLLVDDVHTYFVRVTQPGTLILVLDKDPGIMLGTTMEISNLNSEESQGLIGKNNLIYTRNQGGSQIAHVNISPSDLAANGNKLEFKVSIRATFGNGKYCLTIRKPGQTVAENLTSDVFGFEVQVDETQDDFLLTWNKVMNDLDETATVKVRIIDKATKKPVFVTTGENRKPAAFPPGEIKLPTLKPGKYQVLVELKNALGSLGWTVTRPTEVSPIQSNFLIRNINQGLTEHFDLQFNGDEKFLWVITSRTPGSKEYATLGVTLKDSNGNVLYNERVSPSITVIALSGITAGRYALSVSNNRNAVHYTLGVEKENTYEPVTIADYRVTQALIKDKKVKYDVTFSNPANKQLSLEFENQSTDNAEVKLAIVGQSEITIPVPPRQKIQHSLSFGAFDINSFSLSGVENAKVTCNFDCKNYEFVIMDQYEDGVGNNRLENATDISKDTPIIANISSKTDTDFYKLSVTTSGHIGILLKNIIQGKNYDILLLDDKGTEIANSKRTGNKHENLRLYLEPGDYYIKVVSAVGFSSSCYTLEYSFITDREGKWYSQALLYNEDTWDSSDFDKIYFPDVKSKPEESLKRHFNLWGCNICSHAMILTNLGVKTKEKHEDFRTQIEDYLVPDPFVTMMVNIDWPTFTPDKPKEPEKYNADFTSKNSPLYMADKTKIENEFGYIRIEEELFGKTVEEKARIITRVLLDHPEGIIVRVAYADNPAYRVLEAHSMVFMNSTYSLEDAYHADPATDKNEQTFVTVKKENKEDKDIYYSALDLERFFTVCDPGTSGANQGDNINFKESKTYKETGGLPHMVYIQYFVKKK